MYGRLGNQLFFYSLAQALKQLGFDVYIQRVLPREDWDLAILKFNVDRSMFRAPSAKIDFTFHQNTQNGNFDPNIFRICDNTKVVSGYFQSDLYFKDYIERFSHHFEMICKIPTETEALLSRIKSDKNSCFIHIRRGDFLTASCYIVLGWAYYMGAVDLVLEQNPDSKFYIFSDDIEFVKKYFLTKVKIENFEVIDMHSQIDGHLDFELMRNCQNGIIANSTFSWWAAYLIENKDKLIMSPSLFHTIYSNNDMWPDNFTILHYAWGSVLKLGNVKNMQVDHVGFKTLFPNDYSLDPSRSIIPNSTLSRIKGMIVRSVNRWLGT